MARSAPERECPSCHEQAATYAPTCPHCGKRYDRRAAWLSDRGRWLIGGAGALVVVALIAVLAVTLTGQKHDRTKRDAAAQQQLIARERARLIAEQKPVRGAATDVKAPPASATDAQQVAYRKTLLDRMKAAILNDARTRVKEGRLTGTYRDVQCGPLDRSKYATAAESDPTSKVGRYDCVAVQADIKKNGQVVGELGDPFVGTIDFAKRTFVWCKDNKAPSERGKALVQVRLARECVGAAPDAKIVGNGYADTDAVR